MESKIYDIEKLNKAAKEFKQFMDKKYENKGEDKTREQVRADSLKEISELEKKYRVTCSNAGILNDLLKYKDFIIDNSSDLAKGRLLNVLLQRQRDYFTIYSSNQAHDFYANLAEVYKQDIFGMLSFLIRSVEQEFKTESEKEIELVFDNKCTPDEIEEYRKKADDGK